MSRPMYRYSFPAEVWTTAANRQDALEQLRELTGVAQHTQVGISISHEPTRRERDRDFEEEL